MGWPRRSGRKAAANGSKITFKNYGKTPGVVSEVGCGLVYSETVPVPVYDVKVIKENIIAAGESSEDFGEAIDGQMTMAQAITVKNGGGNLWVYGYVIYDDVFGKTQVHRFFQRFVRVSQFRYVLRSYDYQYYNKST
jgi:hypothetical protein